MSNLTDELTRRLGIEDEFLAAWKIAVQLAGVDLFDVRSATVAEATDKNELRPRMEHIAKALPDLTDAEASFVLAVCSFFNFDWASTIARENGVCIAPGSLAA